MFLCYTVAAPVSQTVPEAWDISYLLPKGFIVAESPWNTTLNQDRHGEYVRTPTLHAPQYAAVHPGAGHRRLGMDSAWGVCGGAVGLPHLLTRSIRLMVPWRVGSYGCGDGLRAALLRAAFVLRGDAETACAPSCRIWTKCRKRACGSAYPPVPSCFRNFHPCSVHVISAYTALFLPSR
jgi:hypothetical protein